MNVKYCGRNIVQIFSQYYRKSYMLLQYSENICLKYCALRFPSLSENIGAILCVCWVGLSRCSVPNLTNIGLSFFLQIIEDYLGDIFKTHRE